MKGIEKVLCGLGFVREGESWFTGIGSWTACHETLHVKLEGEKAVIKWHSFFWDGGDVEIEKDEISECYISEIWEHFPNWIYRRS